MSPGNIIFNKTIIYSPILSNLQCITNLLRIAVIAHNAGKQSSVCTMASVGSGKGPGQLDIQLLKVFRSCHLVYYSSQTNRSCGMGTAWPDHNRTDNVKNVHKLSFVFYDSFNLTRYSLPSGNKGQHFCFSPAYPKRQNISKNRFIS